MAVPTFAERNQAVQDAAKKWIEKHGGQSAGARAAKEKGVPITQQKLHWAAKGEKIGRDMEISVAALYDTTPDGLVYALRNEERMALRDVPGWDRAKEEAMQNAGFIEDWVWAAVDDIVVPVATRNAEPAMVRDVAVFLQTYAGVSTVRRAVRSVKR